MNDEELFSFNLSTNHAYIGRIVVREQPDKAFLQVSNSEWQFSDIPVEDVIFPDFDNMRYDIFFYRLISW